MKNQNPYKIFIANIHTEWQQDLSARDDLIKHYLTTSSLVVRSSIKLQVDLAKEEKFNHYKTIILPLLKQNELYERCYRYYCQESSWQVQGNNGAKRLQIGELQDFWQQVSEYVLLPLSSLLKIYSINKKYLTKLEQYIATSAEHFYKRESFYQEHQRLHATMVQALQQAQELQSNLRRVLLLRLQFAEQHNFILLDDIIYLMERSRQALGFSALFDLRKQQLCGFVGEKTFAKLHDIILQDGDEDQRHQYLSLSCFSQLDFAEFCLKQNDVNCKISWVVPTKLLQAIQKLNHNKKTKINLLKVLAGQHGLWFLLANIPRMGLVGDDLEFKSVQQQFVLLKAYYQRLESYYLASQNNPQQVQWIGELLQSDQLKQEFQRFIKQQLLKILLKYMEFTSACMQRIIARHQITRNQLKWCEQEYSWAENILKSVDYQQEVGEPLCSTVEQQFNSLTENYHKIKKLNQSRHLYKMRDQLLRSGFFQKQYKLKANSVLLILKVNNKLLFNEELYALYLDYYHDWLNQEAKYQYYLSTSNVNKEDVFKAARSDQSALRCLIDFMLTRWQTARKAKHDMQYKFFKGFQFRKYRRLAIWQMRLELILKNLLHLYAKRIKNIVIVADNENALSAAYQDIICYQQYLDAFKYTPTKNNFDDLNNHWKVYFGKFMGNYQGNDFKLTARAEPRASWCNYLNRRLHFLCDEIENAEYDGVEQIANNIIEDLNKLQSSNQVLWQFYKKQLIAKLQQLSRSKNKMIGRLLVLLNSRDIRFNVTNETFIYKIYISKLLAYGGAHDIDVISMQTSFEVIKKIVDQDSHFKQFIEIQIANIMKLEWNEISQVFVNVWADPQTKNCYAKRLLVEDDEDLNALNSNSSFHTTP